MNKQIIINWVRRLALARLRRMGAQIIAVTGSVGKSSTKEAIAAVLGQKYRVRKTTGSYNTEIGICLDILGEQSPHRSVLGWLKVLSRACWTSRRAESVDYYVLEMGADKPGDISDLIRWFPPQYAVITNVKPVHLAPGQFSDLDDIAAEKGKLIQQLPATGVAIVNADDHRIAALSTAARRLTYGRAGEWQLTATDRRGNGLAFTVAHNGQSTTYLTQVLGDYHASVFLPAIVLGEELGVSAEHIAAAIWEYQPPRGRMRLIKGKKDSLIIDSSYNSSPHAAAAALDILRDQPGRRIAVLGSMNELGEMTASAHEELVTKATDCADVLVLVGKVIGQYGLPVLARLNFPKEKIFSHEDSTMAGKLFLSHLQPGDVLLVKGSQNGVFLERFIREIMFEPERAGELLVRQGSAWDKK